MDFVRREEEEGHIVNSDTEFHLCPSMGKKEQRVEGIGFLVDPIGRREKM